MDTATIPDAFLPLFTSKAFAHMATIMADGSPHLTPMWVDYKDGRVLFNTTKGRVKERNLRRNPMVTLDIQDPENPYRYITVRGSAESIEEEGAVEHINKLAKRYMDLDEYPYLKPGDVRMIVTIVPEHVFTLG